MVTVIKKKKGRTVLLLSETHVHVRQKETYLGRSIPENVGGLKEKFMLDFYRPEWQPRLEAISRGYNAELERMPKNVHEDILANFYADFTYNTQRIEGSAMTFRETADLLLHGIPSPGRPESERHEAEMHKETLMRFWGESGTSQRRPYWRGTRRSFRGRTTPTPEPFADIRWV